MEQSDYYEWVQRVFKINTDHFGCMYAMSPLRKWCEIVVYSLYRVLHIQIILLDSLLDDQLLIWEIGYATHQTVQ